MDNNPVVTIKTFPDVPSTMVSIKLTEDEKAALYPLAQRLGYLFVGDLMRDLLMSAHSEKLLQIIKTEVKK